MTSRPIRSALLTILALAGLASAGIAQAHSTAESGATAYCSPWDPHPSTVAPDLRVLHPEQSAREQDGSPWRPTVPAGEHHVWTPDGPTSAPDDVWHPGSSDDGAHLDTWHPEGSGGSGCS